MYINTSFVKGNMHNTLLANNYHTASERIDIHYCQTYSSSHSSYIFPLMVTTKSEQ